MSSEKLTRKILLKPHRKNEQRSKNQWSRLKNSVSLIITNAKLAHDTIFHPLPY